MIYPLTSKLIFVLIIFTITSLNAQSELFNKQNHFNKQDTLRGSITPERSWWDLTYYDLRVQVFPNQKFIKGSNTVYYKVLEPLQVIQIDLQPPLMLKQATQDQKNLPIKSVGNAYFIQLEKPQIKGEINTLNLHYEGNPKKAIRAPWDGGFSWKKDSKGNPFIATSCQGLGASVWWPNKDHMYDEVDSMSITVRTPKGLMDVSNGKLRKKQIHPDGTTSYQWFVSNPINNYGVNINIANYVHFHEKYNGENGILDLDYFVLPENLEKAKKQFKQAPLMLKAFEHWFGPYPFYEDGFKLVEVPYLGMEHQSSVTYGNKYLNGYLGNDLSGTGWGLKFDFIIIHEAGHEWFANNITYKDIADMWIHEGFTAYSENLYLDYYYGKEASADYVIGTRRLITNDRPIIGEYHVNHEGSSDMYYKGANLLHTIRSIINNDEIWRKILRGLNKTFYHKTVHTKEIENYISDQAQIDFSKVFDQYLRHTQIPVFEYQFKKNQLIYRWANVIDGFQMPLRITISGEKIELNPTSQWKSYESQGVELGVDRNYYVDSKQI